jgi:hypothetical protein
LQQPDLDGLVVCRRLAAADDIVVMTFSFLGKLLLVVAGESQYVFETSGVVK